METCARARYPDGTAPHLPGKEALMGPTLIFIPARYASSRFPGKPLAQIAGVTGISRSLIERTYEAAVSAGGVDAVYVTTDDERIAAAARSVGADVVMTSSECRNGTERCAEALEVLGHDEAVVINVQGDAPLTPQWYIEALIDVMATRPEVDVATPVIRASGAHLEKLRQDRKAGRVGGTTAAFTRTGRALYFSKEPIPFVGEPVAPDAPSPVFHHVGIYAYRSAVLRRYIALEQGPYEKLEGLEQLRFIENDIDVHCVEVDARGREFWELNNPSDIVIIEEIMRREGLE
jgi:3-deoxy-manno-octulosonate cytidylyltransferase (CMP-KDO synthetase)